MGLEELALGVIKLIVDLINEAKTASQERHDQIVAQVKALSASLADALAAARAARDAASKAAQDAIDKAKDAP